MSSTIEVRVPDIGDFKDVPVIEVLVKPGDRVKKNDSLDHPRKRKGVDGGARRGRRRRPGRKSEGRRPSFGGRSDRRAELGRASAAAAQRRRAGRLQPAAASAKRARAQTIEVRVPDIGDFKDVPVIEVLVKPGDRVKKNDSLITLESEKASMEVPAEADGVVADVKVKVGDRVSEGTPILTIAAQGQSSAAAARSAAAPAAAAQHGAAPAAPAAAAPAAPQPPRSQGERQRHRACRSRRFAALRANSASICASCAAAVRTDASRAKTFKASSKKRSSKGGAQRFRVRGQCRRGRSSISRSTARSNAKPLSRIKKLSGPNLHRNWVRIPHITNYDEADVTSIEALRNEVNAEQTKSGGPKLTMLAFLIRASVAALQRFPEFNASLDGDELIYKRYYNIGFAADTPGGLVVPVIRNADAKGLIEIARECQELAGKAREGKLTLAQMQGGKLHDLFDRRNRRNGLHADRQRARKSRSSARRERRRSPCGTERSSFRA